MADEVCDNLTVNKTSNLQGNVNVSGNIGIGTTDPKDKLDVFGGIRLFGKKAFQGHDDYLRINQDNEFPNGTHFNRRANFRSGVTTGTWWDVEPGEGNLLVQGKVGIGTTTPQAGLHIDKANTNDLALKLSSTGPGWGSGIIFDNNEKIYGIYVGIDKKFRICDVNKGLDWLVVDENGIITVTNDLQLVNADCAEDFDIIGAESIEPGTVMVIDNDGALRASEQAYDKRVAGVISGAGDLRPGITLDKQTNKANRLPLALTGKVYCKVDADYGAVEVGDLLTTSSTFGHAMKVSDHVRSIGAIIGKALRPIKTGQGLIPILVALQ